MPDGKRRYIATQGCLLHTIPDFWLMALQQESSIIVMITQVVEEGKVRIVQYFNFKKYKKKHGFKPTFCYYSFKITKLLQISVDIACMLHELLRCFITGAFMNVFSTICICISDEMCYLIFTLFLL